MKAFNAVRRLIRGRGPAPVLFPATIIPGDTLVLLPVDAADWPAGPAIILPVLDADEAVVTFPTGGMAYREGRLHRESTGEVFHVAGRVHGAEVDPALARQLVATYIEMQRDAARR